MHKNMIKYLVDTTIDIEMRSTVAKAFVVVVTLLLLINTVTASARNYGQSATSCVSATPLTRPCSSRNFNFNSLVFRGGGSGAAAATSPASGAVKLFINTVREAKKHLVAAAVARSTSIFVMYPVDAIKTRMQMDQANAFRLNGIYNGVGGSLLGQVPYGVLTFGSYEMYKKALFDRFPDVQPVFKYAAAAILGDLTGSGWLCPSEVIKQKVQAGMFASTGEAVSHIWKTKGLVGFYEGYFGGISRDIPFRVAQLCSYEMTKNLYLRIKEKRISKSSGAKSKDQLLLLSPIEAALCGAVAGSFSAAITAPLDRFKTLLMTDSAAYGGTVLSCAAKIWQDEGVRGLATGMVPRVIYIAPSVAIFFVAYEITQQKLKHWE